MNLREERRARALQRLERQGACAVGGSRQALRPHQGERSLGRHELGAVDQRKAFLGKEAHRLEGAAAERLGTVEGLALDDGLALTYQGQRQVRERREVPGRTDRAAGGYERQDAAVQAFEQQLHRLDAGTRVPFSERVRPQEHRGSDDGVGIGLTDAAGVRPQQPQLQLLGQLLGNLLRHEASEPRVDAVGVLVLPVRCVLDDAAGCEHPRPSLLRERRGGPAVDRDRPYVGERQIVARQGVRHGHGSSLVSASVSDPASGRPVESDLTMAAPPSSALALLRRPDFRRLYLAVGASELGSSLHYIALMWFALEAGGPLGVIAVRVADSIPAIVFGLHGGAAADRWSRRGLMIGSDLVRGTVLIPVAVAGLAGGLPLWGLVVASFVLEAATSYFEPAYGATVPTLVDRRNVQQANALVQATAQSVSIGGWALAAALLTFMPVSAFFAVNSASFLVSAALIARIRHGRERDPHAPRPRIREGLEAMRPYPMLAAAAVALGVAVTITAGTWIGGVPTFVRGTLHHGAGGFSIIMVGYAAGSIVAGVVLARVRIRRKGRMSLIAWSMYLPGYGLLALAGSLPLAIAGAFFAGTGQSSAVVLVNSAAQEQVPDSVLGRVLGVISLTHRGAHATGLLLVSPLFAFVPARAVFGAAALAVPLVGLIGLAGATVVTRHRAA